MKIEFRLSDSLGRTYDYVDGKRTAGIDNGPLAGPHAEHADKTAMVKYAAEKANLRHVVALDDFRSRGSGLRRQTASLRIEAATVRLKKAKQAKYGRA